MTFTVVDTGTSSPADPTFISVTTSAIAFYVNVMTSNPLKVGIYNLIVTGSVGTYVQASVPFTLNIFGTPPSPPPPICQINGLKPNVNDIVE
jgi:hypothetical protein